VKFTLGGRRFMLTLGCGMVCTVLVWHVKISDLVYRDIIIGTVAAYIVGNTAQKWAQIKKDPAKDTTDEESGV
jgi:hypothetical protein